MNKIIIILSTLCGIFTICSKTDNHILNKTILKLNSLETIEYQTKVHYLQKDMGYDLKREATCFFDFTSNDSLIGAKYHFSSKSGENVFDGNHQFYSDNEKKRILYTNNPSRYYVTNSHFMKNSIYMLKKLLPKFINDPTIKIVRKKDTVIEAVNSYQFSISIKDRFINMQGELKDSYKGIDGKLKKIDSLTSSKYLLFISKKTYLPIQFNTIYSGNKGYWKSTFTHFKIPAHRPDSIWELDRLPKDYSRLSYSEHFKKVKTNSSIKIGQQASNWTLPLINGDKVKLFELKGKLVLLEFWYPNCVPCVKAIPSINEIHKNYEEKDLKVFGIEFTDVDHNFINQYVEKKDIQYRILHTGKHVANEYGVSAAPTFFLIDKKGKIVYKKVGLNKVDLLSEINSNL